MKSLCDMLIEIEVSSKWINYNNLFPNSIWQLFPFQNSQLWFCLQILYKLCNRSVTMSPVHWFFEDLGRQLCSCRGYSRIEPREGVGWSSFSALPGEYQGKSVHLSELWIKFLNMDHEWGTPNYSGTHSFQFWALSMPGNHRIME